jgi:hypothetical protein
MKVTKKSLIKAGACYGEYDIIPVKDRLWALCNSITCSSEQETAHYKRQTQLFAVYCAQDAMNNEIAAGRQPHEDSLKAVEIAKKFINGEANLKELGITMDKAYAAYCVASAATDAVYAAYAAYAAYCAARAAYCAARAVYSAAYYAANHDPVKLNKYLNKLVGMLEN